MPTSYVKQTWVDGVAGGTPLSAARLDYIEDGIENATIEDGAYVPGYNSITGLTGVAKADLPTAGQAGRIARVTDNARGLWVDTGTRWVPIVDSLDPDWFGADGVDDRPGIMAAIAASAAIAAGLAEKYPVRLNARKYWVSNTPGQRYAITGQAGVDIKGAGEFSSLVHGLPGFDGVLLLQNTIDDWTVSGIGFQQNLADSSLGANVDRCVEVRNCKRWAVRKCRTVQDFGQHIGVNTGSSEGRITGCTLHNPTQASSVVGITIDSSSNILIASNTLKDVSDESIWVLFSERITTALNNIENLGVSHTTGIHYQGTIKSLISLNTVKGNRSTGQGIYVRNSTVSGKVRTVSDCVVSNNYVEKCGTWGIRSTSNDGRVSINGNICYDNGTVGISVTHHAALAPGFTVANNICYDNGWNTATGIGFELNFKRSSVTGNYAFDSGVGTQKTGFEFYASTENTVTGNQSWGHSTAQYSIDVATQASVLGNANLTDKPPVAAVTTKTAAYTATAADSVILGDATSASFTVTLPTSVGATGRTYTVKKIDASANTVTIDGAGSETIDGAATKVLSTQWSSLRFVSDGTNWLVI